MNLVKSLPLNNLLVGVVVPIAAAWISYYLAERAISKKENSRLYIINEIMPALGEGKIVISDRYILSSLILQEMDGVGTEFILNTNSEIIKPDLQLAVIADEKILQERLSERDVLTRFEKENQSKRELDFMEKGVRELGKHNIDIMNIYNNDNLDENVEKVISYIADRWRKV